MGVGTCGERLWIRPLVAFLALALSRFDADLDDGLSSGLYWCLRRFSAISRDLPDVALPPTDQKCHEARLNCLPKGGID